MPKKFIPYGVVSPFSQQSLYSKLSAAGVEKPSDAFGGGYPAANQAVYVPFYNVGPLTIDYIFWYNGGGISGNVDAGIYDAGRRRIYSTGSTAQSGSSAIQTVNVSPDVVLGTGLFFLAISMDNTTGQMFRVATTALGILIGCGLYKEDSAFPLPATATFATITNDFCPVVGFMPRSLI